MLFDDVWTMTGDPPFGEAHLYVWLVSDTDPNVSYQLTECDPTALGSNDSNLSTPGLIRFEQDAWPVPNLGEVKPPSMIGHVVSGTAHLFAYADPAPTSGGTADIYALVWQG
jgi:hypothetical protein